MVDVLTIMWAHFDITSVGLVSDLQTSVNAERLERFHSFLFYAVMICTDPLFQHALEQLPRTILPCTSGYQTISHQHYRLQ